MGESPSDELEIGQSVRVRVQSVAKGKLWVTMKEAKTQSSLIRAKLQDVSSFATVTQDEWFVGRVHHTMHYGIFVELPKLDGEGIVQGLVFVSEIQDAFVGDPALVVSAGQEVRVRIIGVDTERGRLVLSMKEPSAPLE